MLIGYNVLGLWQRSGKLKIRDWTKKSLAKRNKKLHKKKLFVYVIRVKWPVFIMIQKWKTPTGQNTFLIIVHFQPPILFLLFFHALVFFFFMCTYSINTFCKKIIIFSENLILHPSSLIHSLTCCTVRETVIWWLLDIHQLVLGAPIEVLVRNHKTCPILVHGHLDGCVVLLVEVVSSLLEVRHSQPTGSQRTGATDPMTLALLLHKALHCLEQGSKVTGC